MRLLFTFVLCAGLTLGLAGCDSGDSLEKGSVRLRVIHAASETGSIDFYIDFDPFAQGLSFRKASPYIQWKPGLRLLDVRYRQDGQELTVTREVLLKEDFSYTILVTGTTGASPIVLIEDDRVGAIPGGARLSVAHAASQGAPANIFVTDEDDTQVLEYTGLAYSEAMPYTHISTGTYDFLANATSGNGGTELNALLIEDGRRYLIVLTNSVMFSIVDG